MNDSLNDNEVIKRNMSHRNIMRFINELKNLNCQGVLNEIDSQTADSKFHEIISSNFSACFPYRKIAKNIIEINRGCQLHLRNQSNEKTVTCS